MTKEILIHRHRIRTAFSVRIRRAIGALVVLLALIVCAGTVAFASTHSGAPDSGYSFIFSLGAGIVGAQLIKTENHATGQLTMYLPEGNFASLYVRFSGTNNAAMTLLASDLGRMRITHNGVQILDARPSNFISLTNLYEGTPESSSVAGGAYVYSFRIPFRTKYDQQNILPTVPNRTQFMINNFNVAKVLSGTIEVYAEYDDTGSAKYLPLWREDNLDFAAAATKQKQFSDPFLEQLFIVSDPAMTIVQVTRDGNVAVDGSFPAIDAISDANNRVETGIGFVELVAPKNPFLQGVRQTVLTLTTSGAIAEVVIMYMATAVYESAA